MTGPGCGEAQRAPQRRVIILGASNLVRGIGPIFDTATLAWGGPLDFIAVHGHGRSYGMESMFLGRRLPGITNCEIWPVLKDRPPAPTAGLLTDVGNDLLYGASVEQIADWVEMCLERLRGRVDTMIVTELPLHNVEQLQQWRFELMRRVMFPICRLSFRDAIERSQQLNERVVALADRFRAHVVRPRAEWYGFDPIHIRFRQMNEAWGELLAPWSNGAAPVAKRFSLRRWALLRRLAPHYRRWFGIEQRQPQPAARLRDGSTVSYF